MKQSMTIIYSYQNYNKWNNQQQKRFVFFVSKKLAYSKNKDNEFVSGLIVYFIIFNNIKDITIVIFPIRIVVI